MAAPRRIEALQDLVTQQVERERVLQLQYENLLVEQDNLTRLIDDHDVATAKALEAKLATEDAATEERDADSEIQIVEDLQQKVIANMK